MPGSNPGTVPVAARPAGRPHCWDPQSRPLEQGCSSITSQPLGLAKPHFQILSPWAWVVSGWYWNQGLCCAWSSRPLTWRVSLWKSKEGSLEDRGRAVGSRRADCMSAKGQRRFPAAFSSWWNKCHKRAELRTRVVVVTGVQSAELGARPGRAWGPQAVGPGASHLARGAIGATCQGVMDFLVRPAGSLCPVRGHAFLWGPQPGSEMRCALLFVT